MTEYKKLCALVTELTEAVTRLTEAHADATASLADPDVTALHACASMIESHITAAHPRLLKLLHKALETDPNRQIYNETMCGRIQELFSAYVSTVSLLFACDMREALQSGGGVAVSEAPPIAWAAAAHDALLLRRAETNAWRDRCARDMDEVLRFADETRAVCGAEERAARAEILTRAREGAAAVRRLLEERAAAKWREEVARRAGEQTALCARAKEWREALALRGTLAARLRRLVVALRATPEDLNIRRIRCNNARVMADFGHGALAANCADCARIVEAVETLLVAIGYCVEYTEPAKPLLRADMEALEMPCGRSAATHTVATIGYEPYAERFFVMHEPNPAQDSAAWMEWYDKLGEVAQFLESRSS